MGLRTGHGNGAGSPRIEVLAPDEAARWSPVVPPARAGTTPQRWEHTCSTVTVDSIFSDTKPNIIRVDLLPLAPR
jgi:hypothetical protein